MQIIAGFDLGTTGCRCMLFDRSLNALAQRYYEYPLIASSGGFVEQDAAAWWTLLLRALDEAARDCGHSPAEVCALSLSSQGITVVPTDEAFHPLANAISWLDQRPNPAGARLLSALGANRYRQTTARLTPDSYALPKIMWFKANRPELNARRYLMPMDFILARLCGRAVTDHSMAAGTAAYDMAARGWSEAVLDAAGVRADELAQIAHSGSVAGYVTPEAAAASGLRAGTPVIVGAQDQKCGAIAAGISEEVATVSMGTCLAVIMKCAEPICDPNNYLPVFSDLFGDGYLLEGCVNVGAGCLKWYRDLFRPESDYAQITALAGAHRPGMDSPMFFPHLSGMSTPKRWPGCTASFYGLTLASTPDALAHAVLESVAFALRQNLEAARTTAGVRLRALRVFGGGAKSAQWLQILADVTQLPVERLYTHEVCCVGAAMLAGIGAGLFENLEAAQRAGVRIDQRFLPRADAQAIYDARYALYNRREARIYADAAAEAAAQR